MKFLLKITVVIFALLLFVPKISLAEPQAIPTFHCMSLYWSPEGDAVENDVLVHYKKSSESAWQDALPMRYNPIDETEEDKATHRGSVVNLTPGTSYDFKMTLDGTSENTTITASTWSEFFPEGEVINVDGGSAPLIVKKGGTEDAYMVYDGAGVTIDVEHKKNYCIYIQKPYVIVRGFTLKGAGKGVGGWPPSGAIMLANGVHDVVIEGCDISDFGRVNPDPYFPTHGYNMDSGITFHPSSNTNIKRVVIQRNKIHHPAFDSSNWFEPVWATHSEGPQGISMWNTQGSIVIRYNEIYSDMEHMFNDAIGGGDNSSYTGAPGADSDVYGNFISHAWDDALELEGGDQNVRCWNNYINQSMITLGNAAVTIGPFYFWKNVTNKSEWEPDGARGSFIKMGYAKNESFMQGHMYIFNNTIFQENYEGCATGLGGSPEPGSLYGSGRIIKHCVSRNNILEIGDEKVVSISTNSRNRDNDYDYDLYDGKIPSGHEANGIKGNPVYVDDAGYDEATRTGSFQLTPESDGYDAGVVINNFIQEYQGNAPDMGAHENGSPDFVYGVNASFLPQDSTGVRVNSKKAPIHPVEDFVLLANHPNPFNPQTSIGYILEKNAHVTIAVFNVLGEKIKVLENRKQSAGHHVCQWDGSDSIGHQTSAGIYVYRMTVVSENGASFTQSRKMALVR